MVICAVATLDERAAAVEPLSAASTTAAATTPTKDSDSNVVRNSSTRAEVPRTTLPDQVDLTGLVLLTADTLKLPIEYDPALLKAGVAGGSGTGGGGVAGSTVTIRGVRDLSPEDLWNLTNQVLSARGLALVRAPGAKLLSVVRIADAAALAGIGDAPQRIANAKLANAIGGSVKQLPAGVNQPDNANRPEASGTSEAGEHVSVELRVGFAHELYRPKYRTAKDLADAIKPFLTKNAGNAAPVGDSGLLLISDLSPRLDEVKRLLEKLDVPREDITPKVVEARNIPAQALAIAVMQLATKRDAIAGDKLKGEVITAPDGRSLLLMAPVETQEIWLRLIATLDQREEVVTREYTPKVFSAKEVASLIEQTVRERPGGGSAGGGQGSPPPNTTGDDRFRIVIDDLTGTIIVTATPTQQEKIVSLLSRLDSTPQSAARPIRAFQIRNRPVKDVLETLQALVSAGALDANAAGVDSQSMNVSGNLRDAAAQRTARADAPSDGSITPIVVPAPVATPSSSYQSNPTGRTGVAPFGGSNAGGGWASGNQRQSGFGGIPGLGLTADLGTNTLIAIAEPRMLAQLELLIRQLDVRQPQVMLEVFLVSLSEQDAMNLGVELEKLGTFNGNLYQLSSLFGLTGGSSGNRTSNASQGFTGAILNPGDFSAVIKALETISNGVTRSLPRVLVNNNQNAVFNSVLQQPYTISNTTSGAGTTTSFGGTQDAGTTINVRPQIAEADHLVLDYTLALSSFVGAPPASGLPPPRQQNNVSSNATIPDGHTVVVGGIELVSDGKNTSQVPYIGDVPIVGELFKVRDTSKTRQRFYVFIRASVLRDQQLNDLKYLSDAAIKNNGLNAVGVSDGFPTMQPRVVR